MALKAKKQLILQVKKIQPFVFVVWKLCFGFVPIFSSVILAEFCQNDSGIKSLTFVKFKIKTTFTCVIKSGYNNCNTLQPTF